MNEPNPRYLASTGCTREELLMLRSNPRTMRAFVEQRRNAKARGIEWRFNLSQWWKVWQDSGRWEQRGRGTGYVMCRKGDIGPYSPENVFIARAEKNVSDASKRSDLPPGVSRKRAHYYARRKVKGRTVTLGRFPTAELAHAAYVVSAPDRGDWR